MSNIKECNLEITFENDEHIQIFFELKESGAFQYGNQTAVVITDETHQPRMYDTRYDTSLFGDGSNFAWWCDRWIRNNYDCIISIKQVPITP